MAIFLPVEILERELDAKLLLSWELLKSGYPVVIGQQWGIFNNIRNFHAGTILFKGYHGIFSSAIDQALIEDWDVFALEEENLSLIDSSLIRSVSSKLVGKNVQVLANGDFEADVLRAQGIPVAVTGNPRMDILKDRFRYYFQPEVNAIRIRHGKYILINTNFGYINSVWGSLEEVLGIQQRAGTYDPKDPKSVELIGKHVECESKNRAEVLKVLDYLYDNTAYNVVVRPHPAERVDTWLSHIEVAGYTSRVFCKKEGSHIPWTLGSDMLIHTACTTGIEAAVAGKLAVNMTSDQNIYSSTFLSPQINQSFASISELLDTRGSDLFSKLHTEQSGLNLESNLARASRFIHNAGSNDSLSKIAQRLLVPQSSLNPALKPNANLKETWRHEVQKRKFSISRDSLVDRMSRLYSKLDRIKISVAQIEDSIFLLRPA